MNVDPFFLSSVGDFLHFEIDYLLFKYLDFLVSVNPSFRGRVLFPNSVLNFIHIFSLSFLKCM